MKKLKTLYSVPQEILYTVCTTAWNLCSQNLQKFTALKAFYAQPFIDAQTQAVQDAKNLPQSRQTVAIRKEARINLINATAQVMTDWQLLKVYITKAFTPDMVKTKLEEAGASLYIKASVKNWSAVRSLIDAGNSFITDNLGALSDNQNMPAAFQTTFQTDGADCIQKSTIFFDVNMAKQMATSLKQDANNAIYLSVIEMLKDGQQIFKDDPATKKQFIFNNLASVYIGEGAASLHGNIVNNIGQAVEGATITSKDQKYTANTNKKGHYRINRIAEGTYTFVISCPGYSPVEQQVTFVAGTAAKANIELGNLMKKVA